MQHLAVIDCGTNSFHLIVARIKYNFNFEIVAHEREVFRIGDNKESSKIISLEKFQKAISILERYKLIVQSFNAPIRAIATSAIREAENRDDFVYHVKNKTGIEIEIIDGKEEARLIFLGIQKAIPIIDKKILYIDIGGGSTEFIIGLNKKTLLLKSVELGAVRLAKMFFPDYKLTKERITKCIEYIHTGIYSIKNELQGIGFDNCIGSSGTIMSVAFMIKGLKGEPATEFYTLNNYTFSEEEFEKIEKTVLEKITTEERKSIAGIDEGRADIIPAGILILSSIIKLLSIDEVTVSSYAIREGIICDTLINSKYPNSHFRNIE
jgi:exopolyphosphatase/guanosine-5'-triphosphate,3'-diphosphate pyrophosphatase